MFLTAPLIFLFTSQLGDVFFVVIPTVKMVENISPKILRQLIYFSETFLIFFTTASNRTTKLIFDSSHLNENCRKICLFKFSSSLIHARMCVRMCVRLMHQPDNLIKRTMTFSEWEKLEKGKLNFHSRQDEFQVLRVLPDV